MSLVGHLAERKLIQPPGWLAANTAYETIMGSEAYGVESATSDKDIYGFCLPPKEMVFPHLAGEIPGFGKPLERFEQFQQHHILDKERGGVTYDITIYSIVKYFQLCMENNPNMIDSLYTPRYCVRHSSPVGEMVRERRDDFLHKGAWPKFKGYAYAQMHKIKIKNPEGKRRELIEQHGYDVKFAYHVVRLLSEVEQILAEGTLDLQRNREQLKAIRRGDWSLPQLEEYFAVKEQQLEALYHASPLPHAPDEPRIKQLLINCLEHHYGDLSKAVVKLDRADAALAEIKTVVDRHYA